MEFNDTSLFPVLGKVLKFNKTKIKTVKNRNGKIDLVSIIYDYTKYIQMYFFNLQYSDLLHLWIFLLLLRIRYFLI